MTPPNIRKRPHIRQFLELVYRRNAAGWYTAEDKPNNPLPTTLQRQPVRDRRRIKTAECISNYYWFTGLEPTGVEGMYTGDRRHGAQKQLLVIYFASPDIMAIYVFGGYLAGPQQRRRFAENFFFSRLLPALKK